MLGSVLTYHDHRLLGDHGLLLIITTAPSRLLTYRRRLSVPVVFQPPNPLEICANDKLTLSTSW